MELYEKYLEYLGSEPPIGRKSAECGTIGGYRKHLREGASCEKCREASRLDSRARRYERLREENPELEGVPFPEPQPGRHLMPMLEKAAPDRTDCRASETGRPPNLRGR